MYQGTVPSNRQPSLSAVARTGTRGKERTWAYAIPASRSPDARGRNSLSRTGSRDFASIRTGVWCWVCTNQVEPHAPARISWISRATESGAPAPPYASGELTPRTPDRRIASR